MKRHGALVFLIAVVVFCFAVVPAVHAGLLNADSVKGMTQGEFAKALVQAAGGNRNVPSAMTATEATQFLLKAGIAPTGNGWDLDKPVDSAFLTSLLPTTGEGAISAAAAASMDFPALLDAVETATQNNFNNVSFTNPAETTNPTEANAFTAASSVNAASFTS